jgi:predicted DNA-binding protein
MATTKVRRVRFGTRLSLELRNRLTKYCAASGISERTIIEDALRKYLDGTDDSALVLRRFDRMERALARDHRDLELLSEAFGRYMRMWLATQAPSMAEAGMAATRGASEARYKQFAQHLGAHFAQGHRFIHDLPVEAFGREDDDK